MMEHKTNFTQSFFQANQTYPVPTSMEEAISQFTEGMHFGEAARTLQDVHNMALSSKAYQDLDDNQKSCYSSEIFQIQRLLYHMDLFS